MPEMLGPPALGRGMAPRAWRTMLNELQRDVVRSVVTADQVVTILAALHPLDRLTYCEQHRPDWLRRADMPPDDVLLELARCRPGTRTR